MKRKVIEWIPAADNLHQIKKEGLKTWLKEQMERQALLEGLLENYNEGRSMNFHCKACARMPIDLVKKAIEQTKEKIAGEKIKNSDMKSKAKFLKSSIRDLASRSFLKESEL